MRKASRTLPCKPQHLCAARPGRRHHVRLAGEARKNNPPCSGDYERFGERGGMIMITRFAVDVGCRCVTLCRASFHIQASIHFASIGIGTRKRLVDSSLTRTPCAGLVVGGAHYNDVTHRERARGMYPVSDVSNAKQAKQSRNSGSYRRESPTRCSTLSLLCWCCGRPLACELERHPRGASYCTKRGGAHPLSQVRARCGAGRRHAQIFVIGDGAA